MVRVLAPAYTHGGGHLWGFDSFDGVPDEVSGETTAWGKGTYSQNAKQIKRIKSILARRLGSANRSTLVLGVYAHSLTPNIACSRGMLPAAYLDIDCDLYSSAYQALDWAFAHSVAQVGTVIGYDDWWVFACSHAKGRHRQKGNLSAAVDIPAR